MTRDIRMTCTRYSLFIALLASLYSGQPMAENASLALPAQRILGSQPGTAHLPQPLSRSIISGDRLNNANAGAHISESLQQVPGLLALDRQNHAQDLQVSSRGFGARASFGVRGVRLSQDGIPLTMPDGQGQPALFDLDNLQRLEVLRGPLASLYGNASGGIIQAFSAEAPLFPTLDNRSAAGSDGLWRSRLRYGAQYGDLNLSTNLSRLESDGYRDHSRVRRDTGNLRLGWDIDELSSLTLLVNSLDQPDTQDPLGLSASELRADRRQSVAASRLFNTRKSVRHQQAGLNYQRQVHNADQLTFMLYGGTRDVQQFLGFPGDNQQRPDGSLRPGSGGVIELDRSFHGGELGWERQTLLFNQPLQLAAGLTLDHQGEQRRGFVNLRGSKGELRRNEYNRVDSRDLWLISRWQPAARWELTAGLRHSRITFDSDDRYIADTSDDSGQLRFRRSSPALGLSWQWTPQLNLYGALGQGFETPTFQELAYRPEGTGLNLALKPARSTNAELGLRWQHQHGQLDLALFESRVRDEIVPGEPQAGTDRSTFTNAARSQRRGIELQLQQQLDHGFSSHLAWTWLDARFQRYRRTDGSDLGGRQLPGIPRQLLYAELQWQAAGSGFASALELQHMSRRYATDDNRADTPGHRLLHWRAAHRQQIGNWRLEPFVRINNLTDRHYVGSLIVNAANQRYYEPAPGRQWLAGVGLEYQWR